jgi:hypothetical protein
MLAAPNGGPSGQLKPKQLMLGSKRAPVNLASIVEKNVAAELIEWEAAGTAP